MRDEGHIAPTTAPAMFVPPHTRSYPGARLYPLCSPCTCSCLFILYLVFVCTPLHLFGPPRSPCTLLLPLSLPLLLLLLLSPNWFAFVFSPFSQIYGLSPWYYWWQNPEVVRPVDFRWIVIEYGTSLLSSLPMQYWNKGVCPVGSWWANIHLRRVSGELLVSQYSTTEGVLWAHGRSILINGGCLVSLW